MCGGLARSLLVTALVLSGCGSLPPAPDAALVREPLRTPPPHSDARSHDLVSVAKTVLGVPYRYGGADTRGFDCSGLVYWSYRQLGRKVPRTVEQLYAAAQKADKRNIERGDLLFFRLQSRRISHVAIALGDGRFIHAPSTGKHVSITSLDKPYWRTRLIAVRRL